MSFSEVVKGTAKVNITTAIDAHTNTLFFAGAREAAKGVLAVCTEPPEGQQLVVAVSGHSHPKSEHYEGQSYCSVQTYYAPVDDGNKVGDKTPAQEKAEAAAPPAAS